MIDLFGAENLDDRRVKRAILRFAISSPEARAKKFVAEQRKRDPEWVADTEEMLRIEEPAPKVDPKKK